MMVRAIERAGCHPGERRRDLARHRRLRVRPRRPLHARARRPRARPRRHDRDAARLDRRAIPIVSIEDPFAEDDRDGWIAFTRARGVARADHRRRLPHHQRRRASTPPRATARCNAVLIKLNQAGTLTEAQAALDAAQAARRSARSSRRAPAKPRTSSIAHLAVGWNAGQLKVGSFARSERHGQVERGAAHRGSAGRRARASPARGAARR